MNRRFRVGIAIFLIALIAMACVPVWRISRQIRQTRLDRALITAVKSNNTSAVVSLLRQGADANATPPVNKPPSLWQQVMMLIHHDAPPGEKSPPPLAFATERLNGNSYELLASPENVKALLNAGADPNISCSFNGQVGETPLWDAVAVDDLELIKLLLDKGAEVNRRVQVGGTAMHVVQSDAALTLLLKREGDVNAVDENGDIPLMWFGQTERTSVEAMLRAGAKVNARDKRGITPLMMACNARAARGLIRAGAAVNLRDIGGETALMIAAEYGYLDVIKELLASGANARLWDKTGRSAEDYVYAYRPLATRNERAEMKRLLRSKR